MDQLIKSNSINKKTLIKEAKGILETRRLEIFQKMINVYNTKEGYVCFMLCEWERKDAGVWLIV